MKRQTKFFLAGWAVVILFSSIAPIRSRASGLYAPDLASSAYELIDAVNSLRASNGLPAYGISSILMGTAQAQAEFMAANGIVVHTGPGGISVTDRLLAAGYPLAGNLSLGGYRSENIIADSKDTTAQSAVEAWTGDAPHLYTMLSPDLTEIGAGVAIAGGMVYYVIDVARPTTSGVPQAVTPVVGGGSAIPAPEVKPMIVSTPNLNGEIIHEVLAGQTLWQIAIAYGVKVDEIRKLNNLPGDFIYPGNKLLIKREQKAATVTATATWTITPMSSATAAPPSPTAVEVSATPTMMVETTAKPMNTAVVMGVTLGILILAVLAGVIFMRSGTARKQ